MMLIFTAKLLFVLFALSVISFVLTVLSLRCLLYFTGKAKLRKAQKDLVNGKKPVVIGFFHPYCNAGGGGERVLWCAIRAIQQRYAHVKCIVYTGDVDATEDEIVRKANSRFNLILPRPVEFIFLKRRAWVEADRWPRFTLLGQSIGSLILGMEAIVKFSPEIYIDSMGYAFTIPLFKYLGDCECLCYIHYPTISTDMLTVVSGQSSSYNNAQFISNSSILSRMKVSYYNLFAKLYSLVGRQCDRVMVNSSWTAGHIGALWWVKHRMWLVYPPCDVDQFSKILLDSPRAKTILSIGQFRPEKDHDLQLRSFKAFLKIVPKTERDKYTLVLAGSCRNEEDEERVEHLRELSRHYQISKNVDFQLNVSFQKLVELLSQAAIGLHTMWNEHFGIGIVEFMAAGVIVLAHNSGGPKADIVTPDEGEPVGFLADSFDTYAVTMRDIFNMDAEEMSKLKVRARESAERFSVKNFESGFMNVLVPVVAAEEYRHEHEE